MNRRVRYALSLVVGVALGLGAWALRSCSRPAVAALVEARVRPADVYRAVANRTARGC